MFFFSNSKAKMKKVVPTFYEIKHCEQFGKEIRPIGLKLTELTLFE
jgi:hypothetical protein